MGWNTVDWAYAVKAQGEWKNPFDLASEGHFSYAPHHLEFHCDQLTGTLLQRKSILKFLFR